MHLHYEEAGAGPPVVLLHGGGPGASGPSNFRRNLPVFAERFRTLVVDQPGYGKSDKPPVAGNYFTFAADALAGLLDELGPRAGRRRGRVQGRDRRRACCPAGGVDAARGGPGRAPPGIVLRRRA
jgi:hypothetical protein